MQGTTIDPHPVTSSEISIMIGDSTITGTLTDATADITATGAFLDILLSDDPEQTERLTEAIRLLVEVTR